MAPDLKRRMMLSTDSTSSMGMGLAASLKSSRPRRVQRLRDWSLTASEYSLKAL